MPKFGTSISVSPRDKILMRLRSQVAKARAVNPIDSTPWFKPETWAVGVNYPMGTVVVSTDGTNCYIQKWVSGGVGGISAASGSGPTGKTSARVVDGTCVWEWVGTVRGQQAFNANVVRVLSATAALAELTNPITKTLTLAGVAAGTNVAAIRGGLVEDAGSGALIAKGPNGATVAAPSLANSQSHALVFVTDADKVVLNDVAGIGIFNISADQLLIEVNDVALSDSVYGYRSTAAAAPSSTRAPYPGAYVIDLSWLPANSEKKIRIFSNHPWSQISVGAQYKVWQPQEPYALRITGEGDSTMGGGNAASVQFGTWFNRMARKLGFADMCNFAVGGTRYSDPGAKTTFGQRLDRLVQTDADIYVVTTHNDESFTSTRYAAFMQYFRDFLQKQPGKFLVVLGCIPLQNETEANTQPGGNYYLCETDLKNAVAEINSPYILFAPVVLDPTGQWVSGTGSAEAANGTGNADWMWGLDMNGNVDGHPLWRHSIYMGHRFANALCKAFNV